MNDLIFEGVSTRRLLGQIARLRGWDPSSYAPRQEELDRMCQLANHMMERAWRKAMWPQLTLTRSVTYRPSWTEAGAPYPLGSQVYWDGHYYEAAVDGAATTPGPKNPDWSNCECVMTCGISYERYGIEEMDLTRGVYTLNPDTRADARPLPAYRVAFGAVVQRVPGRPFVAMPWIRFRPYAPRLSAVPWANPRQKSRQGHCSHWGLRFGPHSVAPSSISACVKSPAWAGYTACSASCTCFL